MVRKRIGEVVFKNELLAQLPQSELDRLAPHFQAEELAKDQVLYEPGARITQIYFPEDSLISLQGRTNKKQLLEVGAAGADGIVGIQVILQTQRIPYRAVVQLPGKAWRISATRLKAEFARSKHIRNVLLRYLQILITQLSQSILCNRFHRIEERLSGWLLARRNRTTPLPLTQQTLAGILGVPRTLITMTARKLKRAGMIEYQQGHLTILDAAGLAEKACDCHRIVQAETAALFRTK